MKLSWKHPRLFPQGTILYKYCYKRFVLNITLKYGHVSITENFSIKFFPIKPICSCGAMLKEALSKAQLGNEGRMDGSSLLLMLHWEIHDVFHFP